MLKQATNRTIVAHRAKESPDSIEQCTGEQPGPGESGEQTVPQKITSLFSYGRGKGENVR